MARLARNGINVGSDNFRGIESGIDFVVQNRNGKIAKFDVKFDSKMHRTGNMFIELYKNNNIGWYYKSKANRYCYIDEYRGILYMFSKKALEIYVDKYKGSNICRQTTNWIDGAEITGLLIPIEMFAHWCKQNNHVMVKHVRMLDIDDIDEEI